MKKLNDVALLFAAAAMSTATGTAFAMQHGGMPAKPTAANGGNQIDNWQNGTGEYVWKNGTNELCWRDANWTPATAAVGCDGALVRAAAVAAPVAVVPPPAPPA